MNQLTKQRLALALLGNGIAPHSQTGEIFQWLLIPNGTANSSINLESSKEYFIKKQ